MSPAQNSAPVIVTEVYMFSRTTRSVTTGRSLRYHYSTCMTASKYFLLYNYFAPLGPVLSQTNPIPHTLFL